MAYSNFQTTFCRDLFLFIRRTMPEPDPPFHRVFRSFSFPNVSFKVSSNVMPKFFCSCDNFLVQPCCANTSLVVLGFLATGEGLLLISYGSLQVVFLSFEDLYFRIAFVKFQCQVSYH
jgi:hypothetical protein